MRRINITVELFKNIKIKFLKLISQLKESFSLSLKQKVF